MKLEQHLVRATYYRREKKAKLWLLFNLRPLTLLDIREKFKPEDLKPIVAKTPLGSPGRQFNLSDEALLKWATHLKVAASTGFGKTINDAITIAHNYMTKLYYARQQGTAGTIAAEPKRPSRHWFQLANQRLVELGCKPLAVRRPQQVESQRIEAFTEDRVAEFYDNLEDTMKRLGLDVMLTIELFLD